MNARLPEDEQFASGGALQGWHLILMALVVVGIAAGGYYWFYVRTPAPPPAPVPTTVTDVPEGSRTVTLFFAHTDDQALVTETRQVAIGVEYAEQLGQVLRALAAGPERDAVNTIPEGTRLLGVYYDSETFTVYADFSAELVAGHPGGSSAEFFTVSGYS